MGNWNSPHPIQILPPQLPTTTIRRIFNKSSVFIQYSVGIVGATGLDAVLQDLCADLVTANDPGVDEEHAGYQGQYDYYNYPYGFVFTGFYGSGLIYDLRF